MNKRILTETQLDEDRPTMPFAESYDPRFSCLVVPTKNNNWWWAIFSGDGTVPGSLNRASAATTLAQALEEAAEWVRHYEPGDERVR